MKQGDHPDNSRPTPNFLTWMNFGGELYRETSPTGPLALFGFENFSNPMATKFNFSPSSGKSCFGYCHSGEISIQGKNLSWRITAGQWFCLSDRATHLELKGQNGNRGFVIVHDQHIGLNSMGGPIETEGRLRYIDGCTDTLLYSPPLLGDPCLNLLHFPAEVNQTMHTQPSSRIGMVASGEGFCTTPNGDIPLVSGMIFVLPPNTPHRFRTLESELNVVTFHPDSDWGPTHQNHPMINRTWAINKSERK